MNNMQIPPNAPEAEMAVLGSILIEADSAEVRDAVETLSPEDFYQEAHRAIFSAIAQLIGSGRPADFVTVTEELKRTKSLDLAGGMTHITECQHVVATAAHLNHYCEIVHQKSLLRKMIAAAARITADCFEEARPAPALLDEAQVAVMAVSQRGGSGFTPADKLMHDALGELERLKTRPNESAGLSSGYPGFDQLTGGLHPGSFVIVAARPGHGKTSLAMSIALNVTGRKNAPTVGFFSLEMTDFELACRIISWEARINLLHLRRGNFNAASWGPMTSAMARVSSMPISVRHASQLSIGDLRRQTRQLALDCQRQGKRLGLIVVDYIQLLKGSGRRYENRNLEVADVSRGLKSLAMDLKIPVLALSQLNRRVEEKGQNERMPQLSDLRESGSLEQDADMVAFIYRESVMKPNDPSVDPQKAELIIAKHRQGPIGNVPLRFLREYARFEDQGRMAPEPEEPDRPDLLV
jgi:replicative DNA helicase